ncbi:hypothetical protein DFR70_101236 [Nocardia tenerifensis]|uniref:DUF2867 domain-containing protein n=1 Tax=Nocardia tenerifensis TaxID=228006 RepID=A0A318KD54_9NOCA|nr:hypothetical protein [Nocardia tenerifensis]PXX70815.1 hypothetical protein DFR70_101236 [Nocardia tenerifensis]
MTRFGASEKHADAERRPRVDAVAVDSGMLASSTLSEIEHSDAHLLYTDRAADRSAEQWTRAILEEVPAEVRAMLERAWGIIGLRLAPTGTAHTVAGWSVARVGADHILLQAESTLGFTGQLLVRCGEKGVLLATFVQFHDPGASTVWERALPAHLGVVRSLLEGAAFR